MTATSAKPAAIGHGVAVLFEEMHRWYGPVHALDGLTIDIAPGELVALLGPSGCGKTTALRALGGLDVVDAGQDPGRRPGHHQRAGQQAEHGDRVPGVQPVPEHDARATTWPTGCACAAWTRATRRRADEMLDLRRARPTGSRYPHQMSGGQQQRVALARALAIEPEVLLLDEPLSALDAKVRRQLRKEIRRSRQVGTTTLFVTHDQEEALAMGDRVGVMSAGRLEQIAAPTEAVRPPPDPRSWPSSSA